MSFHLASVNTPVNGKIATVRVYYDTMEFLTGIGLVPSPDVDADGQADGASAWTGN